MKHLNNYNNSVDYIILGDFLRRYSIIWTTMDCFSLI